MMATRLLCGPRVALAVFVWVALVTATAAAQRIWTDKTGHFKVRAELVKVDGGVVRLRTDADKKISVPLKLLSNADRKFLRQQAARPASLLDQHKAILFASEATPGKVPADALTRWIYAKRLKGVIKAGEAQRLESLEGTHNSGPPRQRKATIKDLNACRGWFVPYIFRAQVGDVGMLHREWAASAPMQILQIINPREMIVKRSGGREQLLWLRGVATEGSTDDSNIKLPWIVQVSGTKQYPTVLGSTRTVLVVEPFPVDLAAWRKTATDLGLIRGRKDK